MRRHDPDRAIWWAYFALALSIVAFVFALLNLVGVVG